MTPEVVNKLKAMQRTLDAELEYAECRHKEAEANLASAVAVLNGVRKDVEDFRATIARVEEFIADSRP